MEQSLTLALMSRDDAEVCVQRIRAGMESIRTDVLRLKEGEGWRALGFLTWRDCVEEEFGQSQAYLYRLLSAAKIEREISPIGEKSTPIPESHLRELAPLRDEPEAMREVWREVTETHGENVTAANVREAVRHRLPDTPTPREQARAEQEQSDRYLEVALTPDSLTVRNAPVNAFLTGFDRVTAFLKSNPPSEIGPALSESDRIAVRNSIIFTCRKWCDEMEQEMSAGIRVIGGYRA